MVRHILSVLAFVCVSSLLIACQPPPGSGGGPGGGPAGITATVRTDGETVRVDGRPASYGQRIRRGARVATGPGSSALVLFSDGTTVQLDAFSDPVRFDWAGDTLRLSMDDAAMEVRKGSGFSIVRVIGALAEFFSFSHFVAEERRTAFFRADLFSGRMQLTRPVQGPQQRGGEFFEVRPGLAEPRFGRTSPRRARALRQRFDRWDFARIERVPVPRLAELSLAEAERRLDRAGLRLGAVRGPRQGPRRVVRQDPPPGQRVQPGTRVDVSVRGKVVLIETPNLLRKSLAQARADIGRAGLRLGRLSGATSGERFVIGQTPRPGARVRAGSRVDLRLRAREVERVRVPGLRGMSVRAARQRLRGVGLRIGTVTPLDDYGSPRAIVGQNPKPRSLVPRGSAVNVQTRYVVQ